MHPLCSAENPRIEDGIEKERKILQQVKKDADYVIDTSKLLTRELKEELDRIFVKNEEYSSLMINILSFGFKHGIPADADLVFDVDVYKRQGQGTAAGRTGADCRRADEGGRADCRRREPEPVRCRKQLWHSTCIGHRHRSAAAVFYAEAMGRVRTPAAGKRGQLLLGRCTAAGRYTAAGGSI